MPARQEIQPSDDVRNRLFWRFFDDLRHRGGPRGFGVLLPPCLQMLAKGPQGQGEPTLGEVVVAQAEHLSFCEFDLVLLAEDPPLADEPLDHPADVAEGHETYRA